MKNGSDGRVCQSVRVYVCSSIFGNSARTADRIGTGVAPFDAPKRRNDDGACHGSIGGTWHMPPREGLQKFSRAPGGQTRGSTEPKLAGHMHVALT